MECFTKWGMTNLKLSNILHQYQLKLGIGCTGKVYFRGPSSFFSEVDRSHSNLYVIALLRVKCPTRALGMSGFKVEKMLL